MARQDLVTVEGMDELAKKLDQLGAAIGDGVRRAVKDETEEIADDMRAGAPVDDGELVAGIQAEVSTDGLTGKAASTARHSPFVEHGTSDTPAQPFALPAAERSRQRFPGRIRAEVGAELKDLLK